MALQVKPGYQNPLTMKKKRPNIGLDPSTAQKPKPEQERKALEQKRQSLQNEILLEILREDGENKVKYKPFAEKGN